MDPSVRKLMIGSKIQKGITVTLASVLISALIILFVVLVLFIIKIVMYALYN